MNASDARNAGYVSEVEIYDPTFTSAQERSDSIERDALRYREIRDNPELVVRKIDVDPQSGTYFLAYRTGEQMDAAVDASMQEDAASLADSGEPPTA